MEWATTVADRPLATNTAGHGDSRPIRFDSTTPWLMQIAPWLPWEDDPANNAMLLNYAPWATVVWWFFLQDDAVAMNEDELALMILSPVECEVVLQAFLAAGFAPTGTTFAALTAEIQAFATTKQLNDSKLDSTKHLEKLDPGAARGHPTGEYAHVLTVKIRDMADDSSRSYGPVGLVEFFGAPRLTLAFRYDRTKPFMAMFKSLFRMHTKHDEDMSIRIEDGEDPEDDDIQDSAAMLMAEFFKTSEMPLALITLPKSDFSKPCTQRTMLLKAMIGWRFSPSSQDATLGKYFISVVHSFPELAAIVLPASAAVVAKRLTEQLATALFSSSHIMSYSLLASLDSKLKTNAMTAEVKLPENASKSGQEKLEMVLKRDPPLVGSPTLTATAVPVSDRSLVVTPEVQAWLNSTKLIDLEKKILLRLGTTPPSYNSAISAVSRSRTPLVIQILAKRDHLGKSDAFRRGKEMRAQLKSVIAFFVSSHMESRPLLSSQPPVLIQHDRLLCYEAHMPEILFSSAFGSAKGDFHLFDPITIKTSVEQLRNRRVASVTTSVPQMKWGAVAENEAVAKYLDRFFHFLGWNNGAFSQYMSTPNEMLRSNSSLPAVEFKILQKKITLAVQTGLKALGKEWRTMLSTDSHFCPFPHDGTTLAPSDSIYHKELSYIQERLDQLDEKHFWDDDGDEKVVKKQPPPDDQHAKELKTLKQELAGSSPCLTHITLNIDNTRVLCVQ